MSKNNYEIVREAIANKKIVICNYKDLHREMCPHVIGLKNGRAQALFYQFAGESSSGPIIPNSPANWRCIPVDEIYDLRVIEGVWHTGSNHSRVQTCVDQIDLEVDFLGR